MKKDLIVNPLAGIVAVDNSDCLLAGGPAPGRGLDPLHLFPADHPHLYSLFSKLVESELSDLDPETDLYDGEAELLLKHGILVEADNVPERPLFACMLTDVTPEPLPTSSLITAPSLEFEPFDLRKFRVWINEKHLSPYFATAWINDPRTGIRWGYWLQPDEADVVAKLTPGLSLDAVDNEIVRRLYAAGILINESQKDISVDQMARDFGEKRYAVIEDIIPPPQLRALQSYYKKFSDQGFMTFGDVQVRRRFVRHDEPVARFVLEGMAPLMSRLADVPVVPTYSYSAVYVEGATLEPHVDREACEFSFSLQLDYSPDLADEESPWPLYVSNRSENNVDVTTDTAVRLKNGDSLVYKGRELVHYRTALPKEHRSTSLFFHYVLAD